MNYYFITGTSRGIGKAMAELLLEDNSNYVFGISRTQQIQNTNYKHIELDLNNLDLTASFQFPEYKDAELICLINNSAASSEIIHFGKRTSADIIKAYNVNLVAPSILMNNFLKEYQKYNCRRIILNVSSGAAVRPIESWSTYCASKSGLKMISEVIDVEQKLKFKDNPVYVFSVAPGIVDTKMQDELRKTPLENFSMVNTFIEYKETKQLADPFDVAKKLLEIINFPERHKTVVLDVRNLKQ